MHSANTLIILTLVLYLCFLKFGQCYVNVALKKPTYQQYPAGHGDDKYDSSNAVDGLKTDLTWNGGQCVYSDGRKTATWWVNLTTIYSIRHITINFMTGRSEFGPDNPYTSFFLGFSVYISNSTEMSQGTQCYKDDSFTTNTIPAVFTTICPVHGQYVIYYNERQPNFMYPNDYSPNVHNNLCEVEVHGCPVVGYYGPNCSFRCPDVNCQYCHIETGTCQGCKPGYRGHQCEIDCPYGFFGRNCANSCNKTCDGCNNVNGRCEFGCLPGWKGDSCQIACDKGSYGIDCNKTCGQCRETDQCRITDGRCLTGCDAGYQGDFCTESCKTGSFGFDCNETCGHCSEVNHCSDIDGICQTGCKAGYQGDLCRSSCDKGSYGVNCNQRCGFCHDANQCSHINGKCLSGCLAGYQGEICKTVNVALNKPAYQQFPYISKNGTDDKFHATNAVDGRKSDMSWDGGQCSFSNGNQTATWWVNLTSVHSIHHITIYFMTDNRTWGSSNTFTNHFLGFSVYVSDTTDRLQGTLCFNDNSFIADTIPAVFTTTCPVYGQYVIYFNDILLEGSNSRLAYSDLCEVEVYACRKTFYGINCTQKCDESCVNQMCHPETGKCISYRTHMVSLSIGITTVGVLLSIAFVVLMLYRRNSKHGEIAMTNSTLRYTSSNPMLNLSTFDNNKETDDHGDLSESINTPHSKLQNQPDMLRENKRLTCSNVDINGYIIMHENQLERKETTLENRLEKMIEEKSENEDDGFKKEYHMITQELYWLPNVQTTLKLIILMELDKRKCTSQRKALEKTQFLTFGPWFGKKG